MVLKTKDPCFTRFSEIDLEMPTQYDMNCYTAKQLLSVERSPLSCLAQIADPPGRICAATDKRGCVKISLLISNIANCKHSLLFLPCEDAPTRLRKNGDRRSRKGIKLETPFDKKQKKTKTPKKQKCWQNSV